MSATPPDAEDLKAMVSLSRQRPVSYGFCLGSSVETSVLVMHRDRAPDVMGRVARQLGETPKVAFGTASTRGRVMTLSCDNRPPPRLARRIKRFLHDQGLKLKVVLQDGPAAPQTSAASEPLADTRWTRLRARAGQLVAARSEKDPQAAARLDAALDIVDGKWRSGDRKGAAKALRHVVMAIAARAEK